MLRILPPDITRQERNQWHMLRVWPGLGFVIAVLVAVGGAPALGMGGAVVLGALLWLVPLAACWIAAQPLLVRIHERWVTEVSPSAAPCAELEALGRRLRAAETDWRLGRTDADVFQREWRAAYDAVA